MSPTYQAQKAAFQYEVSSPDAALYEVWYVPYTSSPTGASDLIVVLAATYPQTHFYGVSTYGGSSPQGNFSTPVMINNEKTYLVIPASSCPAFGQIPGGYGMHVTLLSDSPPGSLSFVYTCQNQASLAAITLGNPHIVVTGLIQPPSPPPMPPRETLSLDSSAFGNGTTAILYIRNSGSVAVSFQAYYVKDSSGDQYAQTSSSWIGNPGSTAPNAVQATSIYIGSNCNPSCTLSGSAFTFTSGYSYTITVVTTRNNQFSFTLTR